MQLHQKSASLIPTCHNLVLLQMALAISDITRTNDRISLKKALSVWVSGVEHMNGVNWTISSLRRAESGSLAGAGDASASWRHLTAR